jgi:polar amino acid transport system substrate-binding protein
LGLVSFLLLISFWISWVRWNPVAEMHPVRGQISVGWVDSFPYQMSQHDKGYFHREGLSLKVLESCMDELGYNPEFRDLQWSDQLAALQEGTLKMMTMAIRTPEREHFARFSDPYLQLKFGAFTHPGVDPPKARQLGPFVDWARDSRLRISATRGFAYPPEIHKLLAEARQQGRLVEVVNDAENLQLLAQQDVDLAFVDEVVGFAIIKYQHWERAIVYRSLDLPAVGLCFMFSKKSVPPQVVDEFNQALRELRSSGRHAHLIRSYYYPRLLYTVTSNRVFRTLTIAAAMFAGLTGLLLAHREGYDLIGALALASCPAVGGGIMRDLVAGRNPLGVVADPVNLVAIAILVAAGWVFFRFAPQSWRRSIEELDPSQDRRIQFFDTFGLSAYTVLAVFTAMQCNCEPLWLWGPLLAVVQNGGGGILRDLLAGRGGQIAILKGTIYGEIAAFWALLLSAFLILYSTDLHADLGLVALAVSATMLGVLVTRSTLMKWGWRSPPI